MSHPLALPSSQVGVPVNPFPSNPTLTHSTTSTINAPGSGGGAGAGAGAGAGGTAINTATSGYSAQVNLNPPPTAAQQKEPFAIKVMRLPSPSFQSTTPLLWKLDSTNPPLTNNHSTTAFTPASSASAVGLSPILLLPTNIGTVYLGETFRACVSVWQQSVTGSIFHGVGIKLELQTSSRRWTLVDSTQPQHNISMTAGQSKDLLVSHNLSELGVNCLVCLVVYRDEITGERRTFQKFFKFHVHDPFTIHTSIHSREGLLMAEVALTSLLHRTVSLTRVVFESSDPRVIVEDLNGDEIVEDAHSSSPSDQSRSRSLSQDHSVRPAILLPAGSSRSFLFRFTSSPQSQSSPTTPTPLDAPLSNIDSSSSTGGLLGRLQIRWSSLTGENGRIKTSSISRASAGKTVGSTGLASSSGIELTILDSPASVSVEQVFTVAATIRNLTQERRIVVLQLVKDRMGTLLPVGPSTRQLGIIASGASITVGAELVGIGLGVQRISGFRVSMTAVVPGTNMPNSASTILQDFDHLAAIEVTPTNNPTTTITSQQ